MNLFLEWIKTRRYLPSVQSRKKQVSFLASRKDVSAVVHLYLKFEDTIHNVTGNKEVQLNIKM